MDNYMAVNFNNLNHEKLISIRINLIQRIENLFNSEKTQENIYRLRMLCLVMMILNKAIDKIECNYKLPPPLSKRNLNRKN